MSLRGRRRASRIRELSSLSSSLSGRQIPARPGPAADTVVGNPIHSAAPEHSSPAASTTVSPVHLAAAAEQAARARSNSTDSGSDCGEAHVYPGSSRDSSRAVASALSFAVKPSAARRGSFRPGSHSPSLTGSPCNLPVPSTGTASSAPGTQRCPRPPPGGIPPKPASARPAASPAMKPARSKSVSAVSAATPATIHDPDQATGLAHMPVGAAQSTSHNPTSLHSAASPGHRSLGPQGYSGVPHNQSSSGSRSSDADLYPVRASSVRHTAVPMPPRTDSELSEDSYTAPDGTVRYRACRPCFLSAAGCSILSIFLWVSYSGKDPSEREPWTEYIAGLVTLGFVGLLGYLPWLYITALKFEAMQAEFDAQVMAREQVAAEQAPVSRGSAAAGERAPAGSSSAVWEMVRVACCGPRVTYDVDELGNRDWASRQRSRSMSDASPPPQRPSLPARACACCCRPLLVTAALAVMLPVFLLPYLLVVLPSRAFLAYVIKPTWQGMAWVCRNGCRLTGACCRWSCENCVRRPAAAFCELMTMLWQVVLVPLWEELIWPQFRSLFKGFTLLLRWCVWEPLVLLFRGVSWVAARVFKYVLVPTWHGMCWVGGHVWDLLTAIGRLVRQFILVPLWRLLVLSARGVRWCWRTLVVAPCRWVWRSGLVPAWRGFLAAVRAIGRGLRCLGRHLFVIPAKALWRHVLVPIGSGIAALVRAIVTALTPVWNCFMRAMAALGRGLNAIGRGIMLVVRAVGSAVNVVLIRPIMAVTRAVGHAIAQVCRAITHALADIAAAIRGRPARR